MTNLENIMFMIVVMSHNTVTASRSQPSINCLFYDAATMTITTNYTSVSKLKVDCSLKELTKVPDYLPAEAFILDLHGNNISTLSANVFRNATDATILDLSRNHLSTLDVNAFKGLRKLHVLNLAANNLCLPTSYPRGVFKDLSSLRILKTFSNDCPTRHTRIPDDVFKDLVSLEELSLDSTDNFTFGNGFRNLQKLTHLEANSRVDKCSADIRINEQAFVGLQNSNLTHLSLRGCAYSYIDSRALSRFPFLNTLNFACARNLAGSIFQAIYGMQNNSLQTLVLDGTQIFELSPIFNSYQFCNSRFVNLERLSLRGTLMWRKLDLQQNGRSCMPHLHHLNLGNNPAFIKILLYSEDVRQALEHGMPVSKYWSPTNIRTLDVSDLYGQMFSVEYRFCKDEQQEIEDYFRKPPKIIESIPNLDNFDVSSGFVKSTQKINETKLDPNNGIICSIIVSPGTQVFYAESVYAALSWDQAVFSNCPYTIYPLDTLVYFNISENNAQLLKCPVLGMKSLRVLDASFCYLKSFHVDVFKKMYTPNLEILHVRGNQLNNSHNFPEIFSEATALKELDISYNGLHSLPNNSFQNLINLERLDLSHNRLKTTNIVISGMKRLNFLDLSSNSIPYLTETFQEQLEAIASQNVEFKLFLKGNPLSCGCKSIQFLEWLKSANITIQSLDTLSCTNSTTLLLDVDTNKLAQSCNHSASNRRYFIIIAVMGTLVVIMVATSFIAYKQRWKIAWHVYTIKRRLFTNSYDTSNEVEMERKYDAFVAYHIDHETGNDIGVTWVVNELRDQVERQWSRSLFIFDRNASVGGSKISEIIYGIQQSRKVVFVLTDNYIKSDLWEMVLYWSVRQGLNNVIMCCLEDMKIDKFPPALAKVAIELQERYPTHYLEFPVQSTCTGASESRMWSNLRMALELGT